MKLRTVVATRYVLPLHEGGSLPAIIEAHDEGLYVLKFRGAGQGPKVLAAELLAGEIARTLGLPMPEIVFVQLDADLARTEPDPEIQELIKGSAGLNLALDYLPGSVMFDPVAEKPPASIASEIVWFDAYVSNVDRTPRNANLLTWHKQLRLIDHGAALYFHHGWDKTRDRSRDPFTRIKDHILLPYASALKEADAKLAPRLTREKIEAIVRLAPQEWLGEEQPESYIEYFVRRLEAPRAFLEEAIRARSLLV
jgi:hypothetical protein